MDKSPKKSSRQVIDALLQLFNVDPEQAYEQLISSGIYFRNPDSEVFWKSFVEELDLRERCKRFPDSLTTFNRMAGLHRFYEYNRSLNAEKQMLCDAILALNPGPEVLMKSLFLCLEIGDAKLEPKLFPDYTSGEALEAVKIILAEITPRLKTENAVEHSAELMGHCNMIVRIQHDIHLIENFVDLLACTGFVLNPPQDGKCFRLALPYDADKRAHPYILNELKNRVKRAYKSESSQEKISKEQHFAKHDPFFKTDEGLATVFYSGGVKFVSENKGMPAIELDDSYFSDPAKDSPEERERKNAKILGLMGETTFHYQLRHALASIYHPGDEIDPHTITVLLKKGVTITLYDLMCAMSCLVAKAAVASYLGEDPRGSLRGFIRYAGHQLSRQQPQLKTEEVRDTLIAFLFHSLPAIEAASCKHAFYFRTARDLVHSLRAVEELKGKSDAELKAMIDLLAGHKARLPFLPLHKVGDQYYFSYRSCEYQDMNRMLYDHYVSEKVFSTYGKKGEEITAMQEAQKKREEQFNTSVAALFKPFTGYTGASVEFGGRNCAWVPGFPKGDIDAAAYFEKENIIIAIQVKLSNVSPRSEKRKREWIETRIIKKGMAQVSKDQALLQTERGLQLLADKLEVKKTIVAPRVYSLIVTDNFFVDHCRFNYNDGGDCVLCISYFELEQLLCNEKVHSSQAGLPVFSEEKFASEFIAAIENNVFWNFLDPIANDFTLVKRLIAVTEEWRVEMRL